MATGNDGAEMRPLFGTEPRDGAREVNPSRRRLMHIIAAALHASLAVALGATYAAKSMLAAMPIYTSELQPVDWDARLDLPQLDGALGSGIVGVGMLGFNLGNATALGSFGGVGPEGAAGLLRVGVINVPALVLAIEAWTAVAHFIQMAVKPSWSSPLRWAEYAVSAPLMFVAVAVSTWVVQLEPIIAGALVVLLAIAIGPALDVLVPAARLARSRSLERVIYTLIVAGYLLLGVAFIPVMQRWVDLVRLAPPRMPKAVLGVTISELIMFTSFGVAETVFTARALSEDRELKSDAEARELTHVVLSATSKFLLAVLVFVSFVN